MQQSNQDMKHGFLFLIEKHK